MRSLFKTISLILAALAISVSSAQCSLDTNIFGGTLEVAAKEDGFATLMATPEDRFSEVRLDCKQDTIATLEITPPSRLKDGGPKLEGPLIGYFIYEGKRYTQKDTVTIFDSFEDRPIRIGMSVANKGKILLAGTYRYQVELILTSKQSTQEEPVIEDTE